MNKDELGEQACRLTMTLSTSLLRLPGRRVVDIQEVRKLFCKLKHQQPTFRRNTIYAEVSQLSGWPKEEGG